MDRTHALADVRRAQDRGLDREGIPMVLALMDATVGRVRPAHPADGPGLASTMDAYRAALAADQRDDDLGVVHTVLTTLAHQDFDQAHLR